MSNAIKFTPRGVIRIEMQLVRREGIEPSMGFAIVDSGIGMTHQQRQRLFQPFVQADSSVRNRYGGTGLGLAISLKLANLLGGDIQVESEPDVGSTFRLTVPTGSLDGVRLLEPEEASRQAKRGMAIPAACEPIRFSRAARILVADDGPDNRRLIRLIIEKAGGEVVTVENGREAVEAALGAAEPFDLILMDMQMPELDGYAATRRLRAKGYDRPIIALTANAMEKDRAKCLEAGCDQFATKPIHRAELVRLASHYIDRRDIVVHAGPSTLEPSLE